MNNSTAHLQTLNAAKFCDPAVTTTGAPKARVSLETLETLWFNTGTLCNLACSNCYIESSPRNDSLVYLVASEVAGYLDEIKQLGWATSVIGFTGGEPFMNPELPAMAEDALSRGFRVLILTNAMKPMMKHYRTLLDLHRRFGSLLTLRVSIDHYTQRLHEMERGRRSWAPTISGLQWLVQNGFDIAVAGRMFSGEDEQNVRQGFARLFQDLEIDLDAFDPACLTLFPEMDAHADVPEITRDCWDILGKSPSDVMCASSRMVVKRKGAIHPVVVSCTLLPYDKQFELGPTLAGADTSVALNHPHCARFCVLGGATCSQ